MQLQNLLFNFFSLEVKQKIDVGIIEALHPFGKTLNFNPHVHAISTYGGYDSCGNFISLKSYINYDAFHKIWKYNLLRALKDKIPQEVLNYCHKNYPKGFVANIKPDRIFNNRQLINYIGRYLRHPAIANSRIIDYNGKGITFCFEKEKGKWDTRTMKVEDFMEAVLQHIPPKHFKLVRHYGIYSRSSSKKLKKIKKQSSMKQKMLVKTNEKYVVYCEKCGEKMKRIKFVKKPP